MLNQSLFGGAEQRTALAAASLNLEVDDSWCVGSCSPWSESAEGQARYADLAGKMEAWRNRAPAAE